MTVCVADPLSNSMGSWRSKLGSLRAAGAPDDDPKVLECQAALSYWRVRRVVDAEKANLSAAGVDLLTAQLLGVSR
ncbi:hypothetical protein BH11ACT6_BH11ACT6_53440 [soil metagenome]